MSLRFAGALALALLCAPNMDAGVNRWTSHGPWAGSVTALAVDPTDPQTAYVASLYAGIFRTRDGGATWQAVNQGLQSFFIYALVLDPLQPTTLYAGTQGMFVWKSLDRGDHWESQFVYPRSGGAESLVNELAVDPVNYGTVYAATNDGVWKTTDGGCSWHASNNGLPMQALDTLTISIDPTNPSILYLGTFNDQAFKSVDGGESWTPIDSGLIYTRVGGFAVDPTNPNTVYAAQDYFLPFDPPESGGVVLKSQDGGANWSPLPAPNFPYRALALDPFNHSVIFAASYTGGVLRSDDAGATWDPANDGISQPPAATSIAAGPTQGTLWAGTGGAGVFRTTDSGGHWHGASAGIAGFWTIPLVMDPTDETKLWAGSWWGAGGGVFRTNDAGVTWMLSSSGLPSNTVRGLAVVPDQPATLYAGLDDSGGVYRSVDAGATWSPTSALPNPFLLSGVVVPPLDPSEVFALALDALYVSSNAGASWDVAGPAARILLPDEVDPATFFGVVEEQVQKSTDGAMTWSPLENGIAGAAVLALAQSPADPQLLMAGAQGDAVNGYAAIYRSTDGGASWAPGKGIDPSYGVNSIAFDPSNPSRVYAAASPVFLPNTMPPLHSMFRSLDAGATWHPYDTGLPFLPLENIGAGDLAVASDGSVVHVGTPGGVFELSPSDAPTPTIDGVMPDSGDPSGGTPLTISGSGFDPNAVVNVGATPALGVQIVDPGQILATTPPGTPGAVSVTVTNPDTQFASVTRAFLYDFTDLPADSPYHEAVTGIALRGVTAGCGSGRFCPDDGLTRAQAAVQIEKALRGADYWLPPAFEYFQDVDRCSGTAQWIDQLFADGITAGCSGFEFCPNDPLTRAQVAVLLLRAEHGSAYDPPPATGTVFLDVPADAFAAAFIEQFAVEGVTAGCGGGNYCPDRIVTRAEAAVLIERTLPATP
jgi:photosystem II stability/assembly factor-like uncharacterized protein